MDLSKKQQLFIEAYFVRSDRYEKIGNDLGIKLEEVTQLYAETKESKAVRTIKKLKSQYAGIRERCKKANEQIGWDKFTDFYKWFENQEKVCGYCNSTLEEVAAFLNEQIEEGGHKRDNRGWSFEIDRLNHSSKYKDGNVILSCYICNNAKSDVFEADAFAPIGEAIGKVIRGLK